MRIPIIILAICFASSLAAFARKEETLAELITRAGSSKLEDRPRLYTEIARRQVKAADQLYSEGKPEEGRVAVRNLRRAARHELEALEKEGHVSSDDLERAEKELEKLTHDYVEEIDRMVQHKEHELLEV